LNFSGDGTLRKNITIWKDWTSTNGYSLHNLQVNILSRGIQMLKPGGRIVYSTCSLNPIENEAVIATVLQKYAPYVTLKDVSNELVQLKRTPGLSTWKVLNTENKEVEDEEQLGAKRRKWMVPTFFPPSDPSALNLDRW
jgi:16S rRNA C967 or C1407 C5-methylase (RsmB/RsmF family)